MKDQYFADKRDFLKYDLWMELAEYLGEATRLTFVPMLTKRDDTKQGHKTNYDPGVRRRELYDFLRRCVNEEKRSISRLREFLNSRLYCPYRDGCGGDADYFEPAGRREYFGSIPAADLNDSVVLVDPDTGLETRSSYWKRSPSSYAEYADIVTVARRTVGSSVIPVIQFPQRNADRAERDLDHRADRLSRELRSSAAGNWAVHWLAQKKPRCAKVGDCAFFVVIPRLGDGNIRKPALELCKTAQHDLESRS